MIQDKLGLDDEEYWADPWRTRKAAQRELMQQGREGLVLGAPAFVPLNQRQSIPAALIRVCKLTTVSRIPSRPSLIVAAMDLETDTLRAGLALPAAAPQPAKPRTGGSQDSFSRDATATVSEAHTLDLVRRVELPLVRGEHLVTAILLDQVSNQCRIKIVESAGFQDAAADAFVREFRASKLQPKPIAPEPGEPLPSYREVDGSPEVPATPGIALSLSRVQAFDPDAATCELKASFRLPIQPQHVAKAGEGEPQPEETARVPISLLLTGAADPTPVVVGLVVPTYEPLTAVGEQTFAVGHFALDLCQLADLMGTPQTYFVYAFSGEVLAGPALTAFVRLPEDAEEPVESAEAR